MDVVKMLFVFAVTAVALWVFIYIRTQPRAEEKCWLDAPKGEPCLYDEPRP